MEVVEKWVEDLGHALSGFSPLIEDVRVGVFYTAVRISSGHVGVAFTPRDLADTVCCPHSAAAAPPSGRMQGRSAWELAEYSTSREPLRRAIGVAVLNGLSALGMERHGTPGGEEHLGLDALEAAGVETGDRVTMVGAFPPFIKSLKGCTTSLEIIDKHPGALKSDEKSLWISPEQAAQSLQHASIVILSGSVLVEGGLKQLLAACSAARRIVLAGPTASPWPPTFFDCGIDILGGIRVRDPERLLSLVGEGGAGYRFAEAAEKISVIRQGRPRGVSVVSAALPNLT